MECGLGGQQYAGFLRSLEKYEKKFCHFPVGKSFFGLLEWKKVIFQT